MTIIRWLSRLMLPTHIMLSLYVLGASYGTGSAAIAVAATLAVCVAPIFLGFVFPAVRRAIPVILLVIISFAPPVIIFDEPITIAGANLLPAYIAFVVYIVMASIQRTLGSIPRIPIIWGGMLVFFAVIQFPLVISYGFHSDVLEAFLKSTALIFLYVMMFAFVISDIIRKVHAIHALQLMIVVLVLQIYQWYVFLYNGGVDHLLWFGEGNRWTRFGSGYTGDAFNPARAYAIVWDPNYLIALMAPLYLIAARAMINGKRIFLDAVFFISILLTISYQSIIIMLMSIYLSRVGDHWVGAVRKFAYACVVVLPLTAMIFHQLIGVDSLPPREISSIGERIHIVWGVGNALGDYPFGIGFGTFYPISLSHFFDYSMTRNLPPHGWLFELMVGVGLVGYYTLTAYLFILTRNTGKWANIGFLIFLIWGVTSPAITTPYFWIFLSSVMLAQISAVPCRMKAIRLRPNATMT